MDKISSEIIEKISLVSLLAKLGFHPISNTEKESLYLNMFKKNDKQALFKVNESLGVWYDQETGKGGNVIDFAIAYWPNISFSSVLENILNYSKLNLIKIPIAKDSVQKRRKRISIKLPNYQIQEVKPIGNNQVISDYLVSRGIWGVCNDILHEVYYFVEDEKKLKKYFFAVGIKNEKSSWEVSDKFFKGSLGIKAPSFIERDLNNVVIFKDLINYLSWLRFFPSSSQSVIILNAASNIDRVIEISSKFTSVNLYLNFDQDGRELTNQCLIALKCAIDRSKEYQGHNCYNDKLTTELRAFRMLPVISVNSFK